MEKPHLPTRRVWLSFSLLSDDMERKYFAGIDMGGTNTAIGIVDTEGTILARGSFPTNGSPRIDDYIDCLYEKVAALAAEAGVTGLISGIGIGAPNVNRNGEISFCENLPWRCPVPLKALVEEKFRLPGAAANDANAAAVGEMTFGAARGLTDFIMITLGTGVGSAIVTDGQLICGKRGFAGELGHIQVCHPGGRPCNCGKTGCLEAYCSATGVARTAREFMEANLQRSSLLRNLVSEKITSKDVYDAAIAGDELALEVFDFTDSMLGRALAGFMTFSDPEAFVLFGGLTKSGDLLMKPLLESFRQNLMNLWKPDDVAILLSNLKDADAAILGAAATVYRTLK